MRTCIRDRTPGGMYFFAANLTERRGNSLLIDRIDDLRMAFGQIFATHRVVMETVVILPDHLHCIWRLPPGDDNYSTRWRFIKSNFSRRQEPGERRSEIRLLQGERGIWQRRYWEHRIRGEQDYARHVDYIHYNPVKHGLVARTKNWPYSTFSRWVERDVYTEDWGGYGVGSVERA